MSASPPGSARRPTIALILPFLAWYLFQQGVIAAMRARCTAGAPPLGLIWGLASLMVCAFAAWLALTALRASSDRNAARFLAQLALFGAGLFALAILFQTLAILVIPPCVG